MKTIHSDDLLRIYDLLLKLDSNKRWEFTDYQIGEIRAEAFIGLITIRHALLGVGINIEVTQHHEN